MVVSELELRVSDAYPADEGQCVARVAPQTLSTLDAHRGGSLLVEGGDETVVKAWHVDRSERNKRLIRLDRWSRQNSTVAVGNEVTVRNADPSPADHLTLDALTVPETVPQMQETIHQLLLDRPLVEGDILPFATHSQSPALPSWGSPIRLQVRDTAPSNVVVITEETGLEIRGLDASVQD